MAMGFSVFACCVYVNLLLPCVFVCVRESIYFCWNLCFYFCAIGTHNDYCYMANLLSTVTSFCSTLHFLPCMCVRTFVSILALFLLYLLQFNIPQCEWCAIHQHGDTLFNHLFFHLAFWFYFDSHSLLSSHVVLRTSFAHWASICVQHIHICIRAATSDSEALIQIKVSEIFLFVVELRAATKSQATEDIILYMDISFVDDFISSMACDRVTVITTLWKFNFCKMKKEEKKCSRQPVNAQNMTPNTMATYHDSAVCVCACVRATAYSAQAYI